MGANAYYDEARLLVGTLTPHLISLSGRTLPIRCLMFPRLKFM